MPFPQLVLPASGGGVTTVANYAALPASAEDGALYYLEDTGEVVIARTLAGWLWWLPPTLYPLAQIAGTQINNGSSTVTNLAAGGWTLTAGTGSITNASSGGGIQISGDINTRLQAPAQPTQTRYIVLNAIEAVSEAGGGRAWLHNIRASANVRFDVFGPNTTHATYQRANGSGTLIGTAQPDAGQGLYQVGYTSGTDTSWVWCPGHELMGVTPPHEVVLRSALESGSSLPDRLWWVGSRSGSAVYIIRAVALLDATGLT